MLDPIIQFFERLVTEFTWRRLMFTLTVMFLAIAGSAFFELYTGHFRLGRIEQASAILDKLISQSKPVDASGDKGIATIHQALVADLQDYTKASPFPMPTWAVKFICAILPWVLIIIFLFAAVSAEDFKTTATGVLMFAIPCSFIGAILPDFTPRWINYIIYPIVSTFLIMTPLVIYGNRKKKV